MKNDMKSMSLHNIFSNSLFSLRYMWKKARKYTILQVVEVLVEGLYPPLSLLLTTWLFNALERGIDFKTALFIVGCMLGLLFVYNLWGYFWDFSIAPRLQKELHLQLQSDLLIKTHDIELESYDDPSYYDDFLIVIQDADIHITSIMGVIKAIVSAVLTLLAMLGLFAYVSPLIMIVLFLSSILSLFLNTKRKKIEYQQNLQMASINKKEQYISRVFRLSDFAKELRLKEHSTTLFKEYDENVKDYISLVSAYGRKKILLQSAEILSGYLAYLIVIVYTIYSVAVTATVPVGGLAIVVNASWQFRGVMKEFVDMISEVPKESLHISKIREFLNNQTEERTVCFPVQPAKKIEFKGVSFGYLNGDMILKNLDLTIHQGEHVAIVGCNGSGKSTLIKLLLNLYKPTEGKIFYNGMDIADFDTDSYRKKYGVTFQDYRIFATSLAENVLGDIYDDKEKQNIENALHIATFDEKLEGLKNGILTPLTREFDEEGVCFSGGEEQKIAIARAIAKQSDVIIMDEPSAALDPIAEHKLNSNIKEYVKDKTVIYILHRLAITRELDRIYVLDGGKIIEAGTHDELMKFDGKYAEMFRTQAQKYITGMTL